MAASKRYYVAKLPRGYFSGQRYVLRDRKSSWESYSSYPSRAEAQARAREMNKDQSGPDRFTNPIKRGEWVSGEVMVTRSGSVKFRKR